MNTIKVVLALVVVVVVSAGGYGGGYSGIGGFGHGTYI
jgi:hypothetical protein